MPQGTSSPVATTPATRARATTGGALDGAGLLDPLGAAVCVGVRSLPEPSPEPEPPLQPAEQHGDEDERCGGRRRQSHPLSLGSGA